MPLYSFKGEDLRDFLKRDEKSNSWSYVWIRGCFWWSWSNFWKIRALFYRKIVTTLLRPLTFQRSHPLFEIDESFWWPRSFFEIKIDYFFLIMITRTFLVLGTFFMITITLFNFCRGTLSKIKKSSTPTHLKNRDQETLPSNPHSQLYNKLKCILSIKKVTE